MRYKLAKVSALAFLCPNTGKMRFLLMPFVLFRQSSSRDNTKISVGGLLERGVPLFCRNWVPNLADLFRSYFENVPGKAVLQGFVFP